MTQLLVQSLSGLASAASLFLVAAGLTVIFGVTRIVNFAHGSLYMLGAYIAYSLVTWLPRGHLPFWGGVLAAALAVGLGVVVLHNLTDHQMMHDVVYDDEKTLNL